MCVCWSGVGVGGLLVPDYICFICYSVIVGVIFAWFLSVSVSLSFLQLLLPLLCQVFFAVVVVEIFVVQVMFAQSCSFCSLLFCVCPQLFFAWLITFKFCVLFKL